MCIIIKHENRVQKSWNHCSGMSVPRYSLTLIISLEYIPRSRTFRGSGLTILKFFEAYHQVALLKKVYKFHLKEGNKGKFFKWSCLEPCVPMLSRAHSRPATWMNPPSSSNVTTCGSQPSSHQLQSLPPSPKFPRWILYVFPQGALL